MLTIHSAALPRHVRRPERWFKLDSPRLRTVPLPARTWLAWPHSLTERVARHAGDSVRVRVLSERYDRLLPDERRLLGVHGRCGWVREVQLEVRGQAYVVARTVFPDLTARGGNIGLRQLGTRSLGSLLFGALHAPTTMRQFASLEPAAQLRRMLDAHLPGDTQRLWARRAAHSLRSRPLVVTEILLPKLLLASVDCSGPRSSM